MPNTQNIQHQAISAVNERKYQLAFDLCISLSSDHPVRLLCSGLHALHIEKNFELACKKLRRASQKMPKDVFTIVQLADALSKSGEIQKSIHILREGLKQNKNNPNLEIKLAFTLFEEGSIQDAITLLKSSINRDKESYIDALGFLYFKRGDYGLALPQYQRLALLKPASGEAFFNLGNCFLKLKQHQKAEQALLRSKSLGYGNRIELLSNLGIAVEEQNRPKDAEGYLLECIKLAGATSKVPDATYHLSLNYLRTGKVRAGFNLYDARFARSGVRPHNPPPNLPWWDGLKKTGRLLLWSEQGIGDQLLYTQAFPSLVQHFVGKIDCIIEERLIDLVSDKYPRIHFIPRLAVTDNLYDFHLPTGSIPRVILEQNKKAHWPFSEHKSDVSFDFLSANQKSRNRLRVGISWFSTNKNLPGKNIDLETYCSILKLFGNNVELVNLQYDASQSDLTVIKTNTGFDVSRETSDNKYDLNTLASEISNLDVVISVSNTTVHLAGYLDVPTILLRARYGGTLWYWEQMDSRGYSKWYPSIKIIIQNKEDDWFSVKKQIESLINA